MNAAARIRRVGRLVAVCIVVTACSVAPDNAPRDIEPGVIDSAVQDVSNVGQEAGGSGLIYLLAPAVTGEPTRLRSVSRDIDDDVDAVMDSLLAGPNTSEVVARYRSALPTGMQVLDISRRSRGVVHLDVDESIASLRGDELVLALAQIVYSLTHVGGTTGVEISVEGAEARWPAGNGELQSDPLTVYDYPGLEPSTQPAYPAVPSRD